MFENYLNWAISSQDSTYRVRFTDYPGREYTYFKIHIYVSKIFGSA